jgi:hypothetical protein
MVTQENIMRIKQKRTKKFNQQAGAGIWHCNMLKNVQKQQHKKVARNKCNRNWQGSRRNDMEALNQVFGQMRWRSSRSTRKLSGFSGICKYLAGRTENV